MFTSSSTLTNHPTPKTPTLPLPLLILHPLSLILHPLLPRTLHPPSTSSNIPIHLTTASPLTYTTRDPSLILHPLTNKTLMPPVPPSWPSLPPLPTPNNSPHLRSTSQTLPRICPPIIIPTRLRIYFPITSRTHPYFPIIIQTPLLYHP